MAPCNYKFFGIIIPQQCGGIYGNIKFYAGFNYVKLAKDNNGNNFVEEHLRSYSERCHYIVSVMRKFDGQVFMYNYNVPHKDLAKFLKSFEENTLDGEIIEIEKYVPEGLA